VSYLTCERPDCLPDKEICESDTKPTNLHLSTRRLKDDTVKVGLAERAALEVLVRVTDPSKPLTYVLNEKRSLRAVARQIASPSSPRRPAAVTRCDTLKSAASSDASSWVYDPEKSAVVRRTRDDAREEGGGIVVVPPAGLVRVVSTGIETPVEFESKVTKNDSHATDSPGSVSSYDESLELTHDSLDDTYEGASDFTASDYTSSQFSGSYTEASSGSDLAALLRRISSRDRTYDTAITDATDVTSSSVTSYRGGGVVSRITGLPRRVHRRLHDRFVETFDEDEDDESDDDDDVSDDSCGDSTDGGYTDFTRDAARLPRNGRNSIKFNRGRIATVTRAKDAVVPPRSVPKRSGWTSRLICCAGPGNAELLSGVIHEDPDDENFGRGRSGLSGPSLETAGTDHTPW